MANWTLFRVTATIVALSAVAACESRSHTPRDSGRAASSASANQSAAALALDVRSVCDSVAARWRRVRGARVETRDTTATPVNRNSIEQDRPAEQLPVTAACLVSVTIDSAKTESLPATFWRAPEWTEVWILGADGAGSQLQTLQRGLVRCEVHSETDDGDPADSVAVVAPSFAETTVCWRHNRAIVATDTGRPP